MGPLPDFHFHTHSLALQVLPFSTRHPPMALVADVLQESRFRNTEHGTRKAPVEAVQNRRHSLHWGGGSRDAACVTGQATFPCGGLVLTQSVGEPARLPSRPARTPPVLGVSQERVEVRIPRFTKSGPLRTAPRNMHVQFTPSPPAQVTHRC